MKRFLFTILCPLSLAATAMASEAADTIRMYYINDRLIEKFDGSQLKGAIIADYNISHQTSPNRANRIIEKHDITTYATALKGLNLTGISESYSQISERLAQNAIKLAQKNIWRLDTIIVYIDGKEVPYEQLKKMDTKSIKQMKYLKKGSEDAMKLDKGDKQYDYIMIETKKAEGGKSDE